MDADFNRITAQDLHDFRPLFAEYMLFLLDCIGEAPWLALVNHYPGVILSIPKHRDANRAGAQRWQMLADVIGDDAMGRLAAGYGGERLVIPVFSSIQSAKLERWIQSRFGELREQQERGVSQHEALTTICVEMNRAGHPKTMRQLQNILR